MDNCLFCKFASHEMPKEFTYEDEDIMVFPDIHPARPTHLLIVPKKHIGDFLEVNDETIWDKIREVVQNMIREFNLVDTGYRLSINGGGAQIINHLHIHLMGPIGKAV